MQIHSPCPLGWRSKPQLTIQVAKLAVQTGLYPIFEIENGKVPKVRKVTHPKNSRGRIPEDPGSFRPSLQITEGKRRDTKDTGDCRQEY